MADGDGATVHVDDGGVPTHVLVHGAGLGGEGLICLDKVEVFGLPARFFQCFAAGIDRADAHDRRVKAHSGVACDARQRLDPTFLGVVGRHHQRRSGTVVQTRGVGSSDRAVFGEGGAHFCHRLKVGTVADVFVGIDHDVALAGFHGERGDFVGEFAGFLRRFGFVLAGHGQFVLHFAGDLPLVGNILCRLAHVVAVERIPQTVADHGVDIFQIAHFVTGAERCGMGAEGHVFLAAADNDVRVTQLDVLRGKGHGAQAGAADLIDGPCGGLFGQACVNMCLARGVLPLRRCENLTEDRFGYFGFVDASALYHGFKYGSAQIMCGRVGERAAKAANGSPGSRSDHDVSHRVRSSVS
mmetsp:Transcript_26869/g.48588  ORF Transcript_26869/g.48588 Transcript_26869/m.48588 type:complete len:355 (-) Transcript_26869:254-1318(-)